MDVVGKLVLSDHLIVRSVYARPQLSVLMARSNIVAQPAVGTESK
jgi:hypothetical protein